MGTGDRLTRGDIEIDGISAREIRPGGGFAFGGARHLGQRQQAGRHERGRSHGLEHRRVDERVVERVAAQRKAAARADLQCVAEMVDVIIGKRRKVEGDLDIGRRLIGGKRPERQGEYHQLVARRAEDDARRAGAIDRERMRDPARGVEGQDGRFDRGAQERRRTEADAVVDSGADPILAGGRQDQVDVRRKADRAAGIGIGDVVKGQGDAEGTAQRRCHRRGDRHTGFGIKHDAIFEQQHGIAAERPRPRHGVCADRPQPARQPAADMGVGGHLAAEAVAATSRYVGSSRPPPSSRVMP